MNRKVFVVVAVLGALVLGTAWAGTGNKSSSDSGKQAPSFSQLDRNHDGRLTRSEIPHDMHKLRREFRSFDRDGNGWLSKREYQAYAHPAEYRKLP